MPVLHLVVGPNGAGKTTFYEHVLQPATRLPFINADRIAAALWPGDEEAHGLEAAHHAESQRDQAVAAGRSIIAETVFSHPSKLDFIRRATAAGYMTTMHVIMIPEDLAVMRTQLRAEHGGHTVPEDRVRARYRRLWANVTAAIPLVDEAIFYDNTRAKTPFVEVAHFRRHVADRPPTWPACSPLRPDDNHAARAQATQALTATRRLDRPSTKLVDRDAAYFVSLVPSCARICSTRAFTSSLLNDTPLPPAGTRTIDLPTRASAMASFTMTRPPGPLSASFRLATPCA